MSAAGGPVLITGLDHAGKTPLRVTLDAHPDLALLRRAYLWTWFDGRFGPLSEPGNRARCLAALRRHRPIAELGLDLEAVVSRLGNDAAPTYDRLFALLGEAHATKHGRVRWGIQESWLEEDADRLLAADPATRILQLVRDPRTWWTAVRTGTRRRGGAAVGARAWTRSASLALENRARHPDRYRVVRYEALAADPEATIRDVAMFLGLSSAEPLLEAARNLRLDPGRPDELDTQARLLIEDVASEPMQGLGYHGAIEPRGLAGLRFRLLTKPIGRSAIFASHATERIAARLGRVRRSRAAARKVRLS